MHWILVWLHPKSVYYPWLPWQAAKITLTLRNSNFINWCPLSPSQRVLLPRQLALGAAMCASQVSDQVFASDQLRSNMLMLVLVLVFVLVLVRVQARCPTRSVVCWKDLVIQYVDVACGVDVCVGVGVGASQVSHQVSFMLLAKILFILTRWIFCIRVLLIKTIFIFYCRMAKT